MLTLDHCLCMCVLKGVDPEIPYNVSVRVLHKNAVGAARFAIAFTRQGGLYRHAQKVHKSAFIMSRKNLYNCIL